MEEPKHVERFQPSKTWKVTLFKTHKHYEQIQEHVRLLDNVNRCTFTREFTENGNEHLQGTITFTRNMTFKRVKAIFDCHVAPAKVYDNSYELKAGSEVVIHIDNRRQGRRTDIELVHSHIRGGGSLEDLIVNNDLNYQCLRTAQLIYPYHTKPYVGVRTVKWYYGPAGTGKTRAAIEESPSFCRLNQSQWFYGYKRQKVLIFDDLRYDRVPFNDFLYYTDRYDVHLPIKGGDVPGMYDTVIVTAPYCPRCTYAMSDEDVLQVTRRITELRDFGNGCKGALCNNLGFFGYKK